MYDRYTIYSDKAIIKDTFKVEVHEDFMPTYNASPTQLLPVITNENTGKLSLFHWGLMSKWSNSKTSIPRRSINLEAEMAFQKAGFKRQIQSHRCIVPINGFYVWKLVSKKQWVPYYFYSSQAPIMGIAGLWEEFEDVDGSVCNSFIILMVPSTNLLNDFENIMPAILNPMSCGEWLKSDDLSDKEKLIMSISKDNNALVSHPVSPAIKNVGNNFACLIDSVPASDQLGNYTLFS